MDDINKTSIHIVSPSKAMIEFAKQRVRDANDGHLIQPIRFNTTYEKDTTHEKDDGGSYNDHDEGSSNNRKNKNEME